MARHRKFWSFPPKSLWRWLEWTVEVRIVYCLPGSLESDCCLCGRKVARVTSRSCRRIQDTDTETGQDSGSGYERGAVHRLIVYRLPALPCTFFNYDWWVMSDELISQKSYNWQGITTCYSLPHVTTILWIAPTSCVAASSFEARWLRKWFSCAVISLFEYAFHRT